MKTLAEILLGAVLVVTPAGAIEVIYPGGSGTGGTGGGWVSNAILPTITFNQNFTNGNDQLDVIIPVRVSVVAATAANLGASVRLELNRQGDASFTNISDVNVYGTLAGATNAGTLIGSIPPGGVWKVATSLASGATASMDTNAAYVTGVSLSYTSTNGASGSGGGGGGTTYTNNSGAAGYIVGSGIGTNIPAAQVAAIMWTNNAQELVNTAMPRFPMGAWSTKWEVVAEVLRTNQSYDNGGLRVPTMYYDKNMIRVYYAGYTNAILGGGLNKGCIIGAFGTSWDSITKYGPVISPTPGSWDSRNIGGGRIFSFDESGTNYFYYFGSTNTVFEVGRQELGVAYTTDGTNFTKYSGNPILSPSASGWDAGSIQGGVHVIKWNGLFYMFYGGKNGAPEFIGMATASSPLGPWTKYSGNPVLTNAALIVAEPNVFRLEDQTGWGMITGQGAAYSTNLTNWTYCATIAPSFPATIKNITTPLLSPFLFSDNGMCSLWDNTVQIFLVRPTRAQPSSFYSGQLSGDGIGITNVYADALQRYAATDTNSFYIVGAVSATNTAWYFNSTKHAYTNASVAGAAITIVGTNISNFDTVYLAYTNAAHNTLADLADVVGIASREAAPSRQGIQWYDGTFTTDGLLYYGPPLTDGFRLDATVTNNQANVNFTNLTATGTTTLKDVNVTGTLTATNFVVASAASVTVTVTSGSGSPESAVTAPVGSLYLRTDGGYTTTFYVKTNGSGNTGWGAK
jgi:hypothetical protein